ncbi:diadenosine tetraphosphate (Ap4A) hydrolase-like HIT family hydrolase [Legionella beliardensis]|uniref:Diadenosine tetraphosphate (Ap4A) hydrolase-like HIT family hydrolase n=1 Tax=Legionella beliardensis TaxID=91822 RepID=A0A378I4R8_9GAMM|nr:HIT domain-containing protein [Legionella beliardensis]STX29671.1 diadenosine tetraphosphate (Ap4A) hydrolase-like HIT family hydrolase [Legionella beliardensis]
MSFTINNQILSSCFELGDGPVSKILLKNNADYPWLILVPRVENIQEIDQLPTKIRYLLIDEMSSLSNLMRVYFKPHKLNIGALGNIVSQLHIHIIGRFTHDKLWPHAVWQAAEATPYHEQSLQPTLAHLRAQVRLLFKE